MTTEPPVILWFRRDLRLADNPALEHAHATGRPILPVYILDETTEGRPLGGASRWWLDKSLRALGEALAERGTRLILRRGDAETELRRLIDQTGADRVFLNRLFEPAAFARDADIAHALKAEGVEVKGYNGALLCRPGSVRTGSGGPYKVFTPFFRALMANAEAPPHTLGPRQFQSAPEVGSEDLDGWGLHPTRPDWSAGFDWPPGEEGAREALKRFTCGPLADYARLRDLPGKDGTSRLSPHLHWGEISPWRAVAAARDAASKGEVSEVQADKFIAEIGWREFSAHLLAEFQQITDTAFRPEYDAMPWRRDAAALEAWKRGRTGYPIVDAGMRQLWTTGWMHNRVRMIVASFLIKHLLIRWVPELARLGDRWLHAPWTAPPEVLRDAGVRLGHSYPRPIVEHDAARKRALDALKSIDKTKAAGEPGHA